MMKRPNPLKISAIVILAAAVAACTPYWAKDREVRYAKCPEVELLAPARGWADPVGDAWATRGQISEFAAECKLTKTAAQIKITAKAQMERRTDITHEAKLTFPVFISVVRGDDIISKQIINAPVKFSEGKGQVETDIELPVSLDFIKVNPPVADAAQPAPEDAKDKDKDKKPKDELTAADRTIIFGFQLTPEQVAYFQKLRDDAGKRL